MMIVFFYAMCAEAVGTFAIVGAFLAGVCISRIKLKHYTTWISRQNPNISYIIFTLIFFVSPGVIADMCYITPEILIFIGVLCLVVIATTIIGCGLPAKFTGMIWSDSLMIGFGITPHGDVTMIGGLIALSHFQDAAQVASYLQIDNETSGPATAERPAESIFPIRRARIPWSRPTDVYRNSTSQSTKSSTTA